MKLVYIAGLSRIGSTVIERVLDTSPSVFALGEFSSLWTLDFHTLSCSCGSPVRDCSFWQPILAEAKVDEQWRERMFLLERRVARHQLIAKQRLNLKEIVQNSEVQEYLDRINLILSVVSDRSGCKVLIDSSKFPQRAWLLATLPGTLIVHLQRDNRDWLASVRTPKYDSGRGEMQIKYPFLKLIDGWLRCEVSMALLARRFKTYTLSYEEFASNPKKCLENSPLNAELGSHLAGIDWRGPSSVAPSSSYHTVAGNPDRYQRTQIDIQRKSTLDKLQRRERAYCVFWGNILNGLRYAL